MKQLFIIICLLTLGACSSGSSGTKPSKKEVTPTSPTKNTETPDAKDADTDKDTDTPDAKDDAGGDSHGGGCCSAAFSQLGFEAKLVGLEKTFTPQHLDTATMELSLEALDAVEGLDLMVLAEMKEEDHGTFMFGVEYVDEQHVKIHEISFLKPGTWIVRIGFYEGQELVDESRHEVKVVSPKN